jgi:hypothetical protein
MDDGWIDLGNSCPGHNSIVRQVAEEPRIRLPESFR